MAPSFYFNNVNNQQQQKVKLSKRKKTTKSLNPTLSRSATAGLGFSNILTLHVCSGCGWCLIFFFSFTCSAASYTTTAPSPAVSVRIKPPSLFDANQKLIVIVSASVAVVAAAIVVMGCFILPRLFRKRGSKRVEDAEMDLPPPPLTLEENKKSDNKSITLPLSVKRFSWGEIVKMSKNFSTMIGQGGFSTVYLAHFSDSSLGAVKVHPRTPRFNQIFKQELDILLHLCHDNIVQILGYSDQDEDGQEEMGGALVFEYVPNGNLQEKLHGNAGGLSWNSRMWIAFQLARAIEYLHHKCSLPIVHGDIKASNVLLDDQLNCKLCDFGSAKRGFSATLVPSSNRASLTGSPGYVDPHYLKTGTASKKNDVYSFGVIILELITGREAFCPVNNQCLATLAGPLLVDPQPLMVENLNLKQSDLGEVMTMATVAAQCLHQQPSLRPSMSDILTTMTDTITCIHDPTIHQQLN